MKKHEAQPATDGVNPLAPIDVDPVRTNRLILRDAAARKLAETEAMLQELIETYPQEGQSACSPSAGFRSVQAQIEKLRKSLGRSKV